MRWPFVKYVLGKFTFKVDLKFCTGCRKAKCMKCKAAVFQLLKYTSFMYCFLVSVKIFVII